MAHVRLPRSLVELFPGMPRRSEVADAATVAELIGRLEASWPGLTDRLCDTGPTLREYINVYVDGELAGLATPLGPHAVVHVLPAVAGGGDSAAAARRAQPQPLSPGRSGRKRRA